MKESRLKNIEDCLFYLKELSTSYKPASPGWILIQAAYGHLKSVHYLEKSEFQEETLGVKNA